MEEKPRVLFVPKHDAIKVLVFDEGAGLEIPVQYTVLLAVNVPVMLEFPAMLAPPLDTVSPASEVNPVHSIDFVVSIPIPY